MKNILCILKKTVKYRKRHRGLMLQYIWVKKHESNRMRIGMNEEMNKDMNKTQLN